MERFGTINQVGNKRVIKLRYTNVKLAQNVISFLNKQGYRHGLDYDVIEYTNRKGMYTYRISAIILNQEIYKIMAMRQIHIAELAAQKANDLLMVYNRRG